MPTGDDPRGLIPYIRETAARHGVDPDTAVRVAKSEGLRSFLGDNGKSGGAFQLYTGGGEGNNFQKETGLNPLDPANEKATIDYAMKTAAQKGWGPWSGAKAQGILGMAGINGNPTPPLNPDAKVAQSAPPSASLPNSAPQGQTTTSMNNPLANIAQAGNPQQGALHSNMDVNTALTNAFRPIVPDQINSLLGPAMGHLQGMVPPIAYYQPRQPQKV